ncbi:WD and tetratricopeptide repeats protein 1-like [Dorcoceras hygrometricum]|uniref:WD and tetratricopeptide repeats protein 1-like n=1 Tax=Dorcoceras hygrometricum TaxID=472368 RepID=A0A2Z7BE12_9LAMI|nr:WD and tetratricopeptide repeats protein 1-like [Dorcoceras hygrometricum]
MDQENKQVTQWLLMKRIDQLELKKTSSGKRKPDRGDLVELQYKSKLEGQQKQLARSRETSWPYDICEKFDLTDASTS